MEFLSSRRRVQIQKRSPEAVRATFDRVRSLYERAYGWTPPLPAAGVDGSGPPRSMRQHVRDWITRWDLLRLDPAYIADIETQQVAPDLAERPDLEMSDEPAESDWEVAGPPGA